MSLAAAQVPAGGRGGDRVLPLQHDPRYPLHHLRMEGTTPICRNLRDLGWRCC